MGYPFKNFDPAMVTATNEAKLFVPFDLAALRWRPGDSDGDGKPARDAVGLALRFQPKAGQNPIVLPPSLGPMTCLPLRAADGSLVEQRLLIYFSYNDIVRLRTDPATGERFPVGNLRAVYGLSPAMNQALKTRLTDHFAGGRLEPIFERGVTLERSAEGGVGQIDALSDVNSSAQLHSWLDGNSAVWWRFAQAVARGDAELLTLQAGDTLKLFIEAGFVVAGQSGLSWYRVNAGYVLRRLAEVGESQANYTFLGESFTDLGVANGRQASYETLPEADAGGVMAPAETAPRADLIVVSGGSRGWTVLQPVGVVPAPLFSFITCDEIRLFAPAMTGNADVWGSTDHPVLRRADLENLWRKLGRSAERFQASAFREFSATELASQLVQAQVVTRDQTLHDRLPEILRYDVLGVGHNSGPIPGNGENRTIVPQESPYTRPSHPDWQPAPARKHQLRRLYPLRFTIGLGEDPGDPPQFAITQDNVDCARQEYVFHLNWAQTGVGLYYYQPNFGANPQMRPANAHSRLDNTGAPRTEAGGIIPSISSTSGRIPVPERSEFRELDAWDKETVAVAGFGTLERNIVSALLSVYRPVTLLPLEWQTRLGEVRDRVFTRVVEMERVLNGTVAPGASTLNSFLRQVMEAFLRVLNNPVTPPMQGMTVERVLKTLYDPALGHPSVVDARGRFLADLASARAVRPADVPGLLIRASSGWRPPEHNETTSLTIASNHQIGLALDLQPTLSSPGRRNPLMMVALHDVAQKNYGAAAPAALSEALLEDNSANFIFGRFDELRVGYQVREVPPGSRQYRVQTNVSDPGDELPVPGPTDAMSSSGIPGRLAAERFQAKVDEFAGASAPWPARPPTYLELYLFALSEASHVHFTFRRGQALA